MARTVSDSLERVLFLLFHPLAIDRITISIGQRQSHAEICEFLNVLASPAAVLADETRSRRENDMNIEKKTVLITDASAAQTGRADPCQHSR